MSRTGHHQGGSMLQSRKRRRASTIAVVFLFLFAGPLQAEDPPAPFFDYKLGTRLFFGYEFADDQSSGAADEAGAADEDTGFQVGRMFLFFEGEAGEGAGTFEGWKVNVTTDANIAGDTGDGCGADNICSETNDYVFNVREAWVDAPLKFLPGKASLRVGVQEYPMTFGRAGYRMTSVWGHRYIERSHVQEAGLHEPYDRGLSFIWAGDYGGMHVMLANGDALPGRTNNAERLVRNDLQELARGSTASYGQDLAGMFHVKPTGKRKDIEWYLGVPFRLQNVVGMQGEEFSYLSADISDPAQPAQFVYFTGEERAKRDDTYGLVTDFIYSTGDLRINLGLGAMRVLDRRSNAYRWDQNLAATGINASNWDEAIYFEEDATGWMRYIWGAVRYRHFEVYGRYIIQTQVDRISRRLQVPSSQDWLTQVTLLDAQDGLPGNLGLNEARLAVDEGQGRLQNIVYGITFYPHPRSRFFKVSLGVTEKRGLDNDGRRFRTNPLSRFDGSAFGVSDSVDEQIAARADVRQAAGVAPGDTVILNDFIGVENVVRETYVRAEFYFKQ